MNLEGTRAKKDLEYRGPSDSPLLASQQGLGPGHSVYYPQSPAAKGEAWPRPLGPLFELSCNAHNHLPQMQLLTASLKDTAPGRLIGTEFTRNQEVPWKSDVRLGAIAGAGDSLKVPESQALNRAVGISFPLPQKSLYYPPVAGTIPNLLGSCEVAHSVG